MILKDLKIGQQFKFLNGSDKTTYKLVKAYPDVHYTSLRGYIVHRPTYASRLNKEVIISDDIELMAEISFTDEDGDKVIFTTETEADFIHVLIAPLNYPNAIAALKRQQVIDLLHFLKRHLEIKD